MLNCGDGNVVSVATLREGDQWRIGTAVVVIERVSDGAARLVICHPEEMACCRPRKATMQKLADPAQAAIKPPSGY